MELEFIQSDETQSYFVRGHVDFGIVADLVEAEDHRHEKFERIKHTYLRARPDSTGEHDVWYDEADGPGPGAFPVTICWRDW